jgi:2-polyprenyl-3-methyl-5-hydroxy-6-metoxy-1,4-benzoquinol methylase
MTKEKKPLKSLRKEQRRGGGMGFSENIICPASLAGVLDNRFRRWLHNPERILSHYVKEGMTVLDMGCGPGFFTLALARLVGTTGRVIAVDLQEKMLQRVRKKVSGTELETRLTFHQCSREGLGISEPVDFILAFYMLHEVPDQRILLKEFGFCLKPEGCLLVVEPKYVHVSKKAFLETLQHAQKAGLREVEGTRVCFSRSALFQKDEAGLNTCERRKDAVGDDRQKSQTPRREGERDESDPVVNEGKTTPSLWELLS